MLQRVSFGQCSQIFRRIETTFLYPPFFPRCQPNFSQFFLNTPTITIKSEAIMSKEKSSWRDSYTSENIKNKKEKIRSMKNNSKERAQILNSSNSGQDDKLCKECNKYYYLANEEFN